MRALLALMAAAVLIVGAPAVALADPGQGDGSGASSGSVTISLLDVASSLKDDPRANIYITDNVPPGKTITHQVRVTNNTGAPASLDVYAGSAKIVDSAFTPENRGVDTALTSWIALDKSELQLDDGQSEDVTVAIAVPADAPEVEQFGVIWASTQPASAPGDQVQVVSRVGVRVYLSVGEGNGPPSDFTIASLTPQRDADGNATVVANVENTGGRAIDVSGTLDLTDGPGGLTANTVSAKTTTIVPGDGGEVVFALPNSASLPAGPWQGVVKLESGFNKHDSSVEITFPDKGIGDSVSESSSMPWGAILGVIAALVLVVAAAFFVIRRRRTAAHAAHSDSSQGAELP
ncbi:DUF916 domain-containing protein [Rhodococcus sp. ARC_M6]|uniref:DUF916 domain-containing protein n=1 Tax=Rhodococcus sp. ARC_M6 TaxID=2928852 RepID=UPI001FB3C4D6|nr:DUF916 domain-containing protein [Rhodococcus sp. ARC_M6]MCJ0906109.1 DUF916 domain-containing protein [Rhodococcus sp. ARC_M6]